VPQRRTAEACSQRRLLHGYLSRANQANVLTPIALLNLLPKQSVGLPGALPVAQASKCNAPVAPAFFVAA
jgi:hypothetical protein